MEPYSDPSYQSGDERRRDCRASPAACRIFSDLGIRSSQDPLALNYFEKIRHAAGDARDLIVSLRREIQEREGSLGFSAQEPSSGNVGFPSESTHSKTES